MNDFRSAARGLMRAPALTTVLVASLAFGAGANAMLYSMANALLLRVPAVADPGSLVSVHTSQYGGGQFGDSSYPDFQSIAADLGPFEGIAASDESRMLTVQTPERPREVRVAAVSESFFRLLGVPAHAGRLPDGSAANEAMIGAALWIELGGDDTVLDRMLTIGDREFAVVGVAPRDFTGLSLHRECAIWIRWDPMRRSTIAAADVCRLWHV
jgi:hypothetical protein